MRTTIHNLLDKIEPNTPPSMRFTRIVDVDCIMVLEMRDPNEGTAGGPESKTRYQYLLGEDGKIWTRTLPPETVGADGTSSHWRICEAPQGLIAEYAAIAQAVPMAVLRRLCMYSDSGMGMETFYRVGNRDVTDPTPVEQVFGPITNGWYDVPLPPCPDCSGKIVWAEAGYAPGARQCTSCGSMFSVETHHG